MSHSFTAAHIRSKDGTSIGYRKTGGGDALILVHGAMQTSLNFTRLGSILADDFTVYIPDRRGRGLSTGESKPGLEQESEDIAALIQASGAKQIFGLSSGAIISLNTAIENPEIKKLALYEPPLPISGTDPEKLLKRIMRALAADRTASAFVQMIKEAADPSLMSFVPSFILTPAFSIMLNRQEKNPEPGTVILKDLVRAIPYDLQAVIDSKNLLGRCASVQAEVLLLGGTKSQRFLTKALDRIEPEFANIQRKQFQGLGHIASDNSERPELVAVVLKEFFASK